MDVYEKLQILSAAARYDAACTSSGVDRAAPKGGIGSSVACGICHSFAADGRCISLLKILMSNACTYDCKYCINAKTNDVPRATFTPREIADLTINFYRRNYIEGLFLSSGVLGSPTRTTELMIDAITILRDNFKFYGYIHAKVIPGTEQATIDRLGLLVDRLSVNIELPSNDSLQKLAPCKSKESILQPMGYLKRRIEYGGRELLPRNTQGNPLLAADPLDERFIIEAGNSDSSSDSGNSGDFSRNPSRQIMSHDKGFLAYRRGKFAPSGQSTQMIIGASPESDLSILRLTEALYQKYSLKRVFFSAYVPVVDNPSLPALDAKPPLLRENRLYQADWLMRVYGFKSSEILDEKNHTFNPYLDPKCNWAVNHPEFFPVEINRAAYEVLLRVPGIGVICARKIIRARRAAPLTFPDLKKLGVVLKRAQYFILCSGQPLIALKLDPNSILNALLSKSAIDRLSDTRYAAQISMFESKVADEDALKCITGQM